MAKCVLCNEEGKASREHVIPTWLDGPMKRSRPLEPGLVRVGFTHRYTPAPDSGHVGREWSAAGPDLVTKQVCRTCNTDVLGELESTIQRAVGDMVVGRPVVLSSADQLAVATWCYKTILLMQLVRPGPQFLVIPPERYAEFHRLRHPPVDTRIWLGVVIQGTSVLHEATTTVDMTTLSTCSPGYFAALSIGNLLILCGGRCNPSSDPLRVETRAAKKQLLPLWPASVRPINWPPPVAIRDLSSRTLVDLI
jgi:hypothetical protein